MPRISLFADESGDFTFSRDKQASRFFILTTVTMADCAAINASLVDLRHALAWEGIDHPGPFHASSDPAPTRARVYDAVASHEFRIDSLILEKPKAQPSIRPTPERFYQYAWFYLMKYLTPQLARAGDQLLVVAASIGTKKKRRAFYSGLQDVMLQVAAVDWRTACWTAASDPCLQVADYCGWAIQRKWENNDSSAYERIAGKIQSEYDLFRFGRTNYY